MDNTDHVVSVLEMSHWDVARAAAFLLNNTKSSSTTATKVFTKLRNISALTDSSEESSDSASGSTNSVDQVNNNDSSSTETSGLKGSNRKDSSRPYLRPTHV